MLETIKLLKGDFVALDLGSAHSASLFKRHMELAPAATLIEIDPLSGNTAQDTRFHRRVCLKKVVSGKPGRRKLIQRKFPDCSSVLEPKPALVEAYGLADYFIKVGEVDLDCETISTMLKEEGIERVDFFKTDLEGLDFEVLCGAPELVENAMCVQCEARFQPFFEGEASFDQISAHLTSRGFEMITFRPAIWKYAVPYQEYCRDGRLVWADVVFFLSPEKVRQKFGGQASKAFVKQIMIAKLIGMNNYAEYLNHIARTGFPEPVRREIDAFLRPGFSPVRSLLILINRLPMGWMIIGAARRFFHYCYSTTRLYKDKLLGALEEQI